MDIDAEIEKNRSALLRIVSCWLFAASFLGETRVLPRRLGAWVLSLICKAEKAAYFLIVALSHRMSDVRVVRNRHARRAFALFDQRFVAAQRYEVVSFPTAGYITARLSVLKALLGYLDAFAAELARQRLIWCALRIVLLKPNLLLGRALHIAGQNLSCHHNLAFSIVGHSVCHLSMRGNALARQNLRPCQFFFEVQFVGSKLATIGIALWRSKNTLTSQSFSIWQRRSRQLPRQSLHRKMKTLWAARFWRRNILLLSRF